MRSQAMTTKKNSMASVAVCAIFAVALLVFQVNVSTTLWKFRLMHRNPDDGTESWTQRSIFRPGPLTQLKPRPKATSAIRCDRSHQSYDICSIDAPTVLDPTNAAFFLVHPSPAAAAPTPEKIRPHPRKWEAALMCRIREFTLTAGPAPAPCNIVHPAPAIVFSASGYRGNVFHEFNDILIPLFITVQTIYEGTRDFIPVVDGATERWVRKYANLFPRFSKHPMLIINGTDDGSRHCFPSATVGLISHGFMTVNPELILNSRNLSHFRELLDKAYSGGDTREAAPSTVGKRRRPRLVFVVRGRGVGRVLLNQDEVKKAAEATGFEVVVFEPKGTTPLKEAYALINSSHAMIGVHGAALTHFLFLRPGAVLVQVVPLGADWASEICYGNPAKVLGLDYMEYRMTPEESSLTEKYGRESKLIKDPAGARGDQWGEVMDIYLKKQNVTLDLVRFGGTLKEAYLKAKKFMENES